MQLVDALVTALRDWDVRRVFGVSGANIEHFHDAIHRLGGDALESVMTKSEAGAAFMADAKARIDRGLGVCCATSGGGMMNLAVGVAESYAESVPVLAIVGQVPTELEGRGGFQDSSGIGRTVDALAMWRSMTKYAAKIDSPNRFWETLHEAARTAVSGRPGPAVLLIPRDMYEMDVGERPRSFPRDLTELRPPQSLPDATSLRRLFELIRDAERPVCIVGTGVDRCSRPRAVTQFLQQTGVPVVTTMANVGSFPNNAAQYLGSVGVAGHPSAHEYINERADLLVVVGCGLNVMARGPLAAGLRRARLAAVNIDAGTVRRIADTELIVETDAGVAFTELTAMWRKAPFQIPPPQGYELTQFRPALADPTANVDDDQLLQSHALAELQEFLPQQGAIFFDAGNCAAAALHQLQIPEGTTTTIALGMGGMGYAIAGAIGGQLANTPPPRSVVLCGDGAFLMHGLEVHTAVELGLPVLFVVFNNGKHGMCVTRQQRFFAGRIECSEYDAVDIAAMARSFGDEAQLWTGRARSRGELRELLAAYDRASPGPGVLELVLPVEEVPPFTPLLGADAATQAVDRLPVQLPRARSIA